MYENHKVCAKTAVKEKEKTQVRKSVAIAYRNYRDAAMRTSRGFTLNAQWTKRISENAPFLTQHQVSYIFTEWDIRNSEPSFVSMSLSRPLYGSLLGVVQDANIMGVIMSMMNTVDSLTRAYGFFDIFMGDIHTRTYQESAISDSEVIACKNGDKVTYFAHVKVKRPSFSMIRDKKKRESFKKKWEKLQSKTWLFTWTVDKDSPLAKGTTYKSFDLTTVMKKFDLFAM